MRKRHAWLFVFLLLFLVSCAFYKLEKNLGPDEQEFLTTVRFIISKQERKQFLNLPPSERKDFIKEFWKKRDPDPETEINEYKEEYLGRVEAAKQLFSDAGRTGWLQDRGRIYVLLGPPEQREVYPRGYTFYGPPMEIWWYGFYQLIFIDSRWNGNYELQPASARLLADINTTQMQMRPLVETEKGLFDFNLDIKKTSERELLIQISIPYRDLWFSSEGNELKTTLEVLVEVYDAFNKRIREQPQSYPLSLSQEKLLDLMDKDYLIEISLQLDPGKYRAAITLQNLTGQTKVRKNINFTI